MTIVALVFGRPSTRTWQTSLRSAEDLLLDGLQVGQRRGLCGLGIPFTQRLEDCGVFAESREVFTATLEQLVR